MKCKSEDSSDGWELRSSTNDSKPCDGGCSLKDVYPSDSGVYWCEYRRRECSNRVNITVTGTEPMFRSLHLKTEELPEIQNIMLTLSLAALPDGTVILEVPALPVTAGNTVTLRCSHRERYSPYATSAFRTVFYKDDVFIGTEPTGEMILPAVSMSDQGSYRCEHPEKGKSQQSWLSITGDFLLNTTKPK